MIDPKDEDIQKSVDLDQQKENEIEEESVQKEERREVEEGELPLPVADRDDGKLHAEGNDNDAIQQPMGGVQADKLDSEVRYIYMQVFLYSTITVGTYRYLHYLDTVRVSPFIIIY